MGKAKQKAVTAERAQAAVDNIVDALNYITAWWSVSKNSPTRIGSKLAIRKLFRALNALSPKLEAKDIQPSVEQVKAIRKYCRDWHKTMKELSYSMTETDKRSLGIKR